MNECMSLLTDYIIQSGTLILLTFSNTHLDKNVVRLYTLTYIVCGRTRFFMNLPITIFVFLVTHTERFEVLSDSG